MFENDESPKFSASRPVNGVTSIAMNHAFTALLRDFILDVEGRKEPEIWAFAKALGNPGNKPHRDDHVRESSLYS